MMELEASIAHRCVGEVWVNYYSIRGQLETCGNNYLFDFEPKNY